MKNITSKNKSRNKYFDWRQYTGLLLYFLQVL